MIEDDNSGTPEFPLVSIIIPVFRGGRFLRQAIDSALAQTWPAVEVLVVDDGSDDGGATRAIALSYGDKIRLITKPNGGVATALNSGIAAMRGEWFSWLSHDDLYKPTKIAAYMAVARTLKEPAVLFGNVDMIDEDGRFLQLNDLTKGFFETDGLWAVMEARISGCATLVSRQIAKSFAFDPALPTTQDYKLWFEIAKQHPFVPVYESHVLSRVHENQGSRSFRHLEEANLLWCQMLEERIESPAQLKRVWGFLRDAPYHGAKALALGRMKQLLKDQKTVLIVEAENADGLSRQMAKVQASGTAVEKLIVLDRTQDAWVSFNERRTIHSTPAEFIRLAGHPDAQYADLIQALYNGQDSNCMVFLSAGSTVSADNLTEALLDLYASPAVAYMHMPATPPEDFLTLLMRGSVLGLRSMAILATNPNKPPVQTLYRSGLRIRHLKEAAITQHATPVNLAGQLQAESVPRIQTGERITLQNHPITSRPTLLLFTHGVGGGTIRYADMLAAKMRDKSNVLFGWGTDEQNFFLSSVDPMVPEAAFDVANGLSNIAHALKSLGVNRVDVLHTYGFDAHIESLLDQLGVPFDVTLLDYQMIADSPHMTDTRGRFTGDFATGQKNRRAFRPLLQGADRIVACSGELAARARRLAPHLTIRPVLLPEPGKPHKFALHASPLRDNETMRVLLLGVLTAHKGRDIILDVVRETIRQRLDITFYSLGAGTEYPPADLQISGRLKVLGSFEQSRLMEFVCQLRPHLAWFPFTAAETHSFALSDAMANGLPVLATGIGAVPERTYGRPGTWLVPPDEANAEGFLQWLCRLQQDRLKTPENWIEVDHLPMASADYYDREYFRPTLNAF
ncbi:glycosyltransferase [Aureimonas fodinaquatilis]|uniref:Glycosyltransferase n=1 Tax=Aureimonas fodinaquatilis TaxID=2565783 RepID=A0A5B0DYH1_9HYPH|nr:glycosyltransferase [Aureimonas fodinaquatilis]KAA0971062.1 glycosyltransferase [Aureimonas fodinaquatilis]